MTKTIGILTGGGDCAGLNTVIASIVKVGVRKGYKFIGFYKGWNGVLEKKYRTLGLDDVRGISHRGGTILGTTNHGRFNAKGSKDGQTIPREVLEEAKANLEEVGVDGIIVLGGDGTLAGALQLSALGVNLVGVPKTIDNDLSATDKTFGFSTAVDVAVESIDRIHTTATSHDRVFFVECMGRYTGWVTLEAGLAANANAILLPEFPVDVDDLIGFMRHRLGTRGSAIVAVAEGVELGDSGDESATDSYVEQEAQLAGVSSVLMREVEKRAPGEFEMRNVILGHTQRGGRPNAEDRILSKRYGVAALEAFDKGLFDHMVRLKNGEIENVHISEATGESKRVTHDDPRYETAKSLGVYLNS